MYWCIALSDLFFLLVSLFFSNQDPSPLWQKISIFRWIMQFLFCFHLLFVLSIFYYSVSWVLLRWPEQTCNLHLICNLVGLVVTFVFSHLMQSFFSRYLEFCYQGIPIFLKPFDESNDIWIYECVLSLILFIELFSHFGSCQHWINRHTCFGLLQNRQDSSLSLSLNVSWLFSKCFWFAFGEKKRVMCF